MIRQQKENIETISKKEAKSVPAKEKIPFPEYVPHQTDKKESQPFGYIEDAVVQRRPSDFRKEIKAEKESEIRSVALLRSRSNWGKVELALEQHGALTEQNFQEREDKLNELAECIDAYENAEETDEEARRKKPQRRGYCEHLCDLIARERAEIARFRQEYGQIPVEEYVKDKDIKIETERKEADRHGGTPTGRGNVAEGRTNKEKGVMFIRDASWVDRYGQEGSKQWEQGMVARFFEGWAEPVLSGGNGIYEKVTDEEDVSFFSRIGTGFVRKDDVVRVNRTLAQGYQYQSVGKYEPLFAGQPKPEDVRQGALGDCYLLSAMIAVVKQRPEHFFYHMMDCGDTVIVKMYRSDSTPVFVKVDKTVVVRRQRRMFADGALWVCIYEKAYAAAGFTGSALELPKGKRSYGFIAGGSEEAALRHITGQSSAEYEFNPAGQLDEQRLILLSSLIGQYAQSRLDSDILGAVGEVYKECSDMIESDFKKAVPQSTVKLWCNKEFIKTCIRCKVVQNRENAAANAVQGDAAAGAGQENAAAGADQTVPGNAAANAGQGNVAAGAGQGNAAVNAGQGNVRLTQGEEVFIDGVASQMAQTNQAEFAKYLPGVPGEGGYSQEEIRLFTMIKAWLDGGKPVTVSTKKDVAEVLDGQQEAGRAGEGVRGGLVGPHGYAVMDYHLEETADGPTNMAVRLRNPWGDTGRGYFSSPERRANQRVDITNRVDHNQLYGGRIDDGEFWIDMSELIRYFRAVSHEN